MSRPPARRASGTEGLLPWHGGATMKLSGRVSFLSATQLRTGGARLQRFGGRGRQRQGHAPLVDEVRHAVGRRRLLRLRKGKERGIKRSAGAASAPLRPCGGAGAPCATSFWAAQRRRRSCRRSSRHRRAERHAPDVARCRARQSKGWTRIKARGALACDVLDTQKESGLGRASVYDNAGTRVQCVARRRGACACRQLKRGWR